VPDLLLSYHVQCIHGYTERTDHPDHRGLLIRAAEMLTVRSGATREPDGEHQISIWCSQPSGLVCSVNDVVNVLPCPTWAYLNDGPCLTSAAFTGLR